MVNVRGRLIPLLRLSEFFGTQAALAVPGDGVVVVVEVDDVQRGLLVDQLLGKQEVVIKSLGTLANQSRAIAGAAILGDGRVGLILDVSELIKSRSHLRHKSN
jgi:two-component system chemotaxis sensor kinase CheA